MHGFRLMVNFGFKAEKLLKPEATLKLLKLL